MTATSPQLNSFALVIGKYDLEVYSSSGTIGLPPTNGNIDGTQLVYMTLSGAGFSGTLLGKPVTVGGAFHIYFFPTGSNLQAPSWNFTSDGKINVILEMDICELPGVSAVLQSASLPKANPAQITYSETLSASGKVVATGEIGTQNGARN
jgi:hypothetical protein